VKQIVNKIPIHALGSFYLSINIECRHFVVVSEKLIRTQAQLLVDGGYLAAGYDYIIIDDCWLNTTRAPVCHNKAKKYEDDRLFF